MKTTLPLLACTSWQWLARAASSMLRSECSTSPDQVRLRKRSFCSALWLAIVLGGAALLSGTGAVNEDWLPCTFPAGLATSTNNFAIEVDGDGNVYVGTTTSGGATGADMLLIKYDCHGTMLWFRTVDFNNAQRNDYLTSIALGPGGGIIVTGSSEMNVSGARQWVTVKFNRDGNVRWVSVPQGTLNPRTRPRAIAVDMRASVLVSGIDVMGGIPRIRLIKFAGGNGQVMASGNSSAVSAGGEDMAEGYSSFTGGAEPRMVLDAPGNAYITGWSSISAGRQCLTLRFPSASGGSSYTPTFHLNGLGSPPNAIGTAIALNAAGNRIYVLGRDEVTNPRKWTILGYRSNPVTLDTVWGSSGVLDYPGGSVPFGQDNRPGSIATDSSENVLVTGWTDNGSRRDFLTAKWLRTSVTTPNVFQWQATTALSPGLANFDSFEPMALKVDIAGNAYVTGMCRDTATLGLNFLTIRYGLNGAPEDWFDVHDYNSGFSYDDRSLAMALDGSGDVYVTGPSYLAASGTYLVDTVKYSQGPPINDTCAMARTILPPNSGTVAFSTRFANDTSPAVSSCGADSSDVWFQWTAPCGGTVDIDTFGSCFDTVLAVYTGACPPGTLMPVLGACNNDATAGRPFGSIQHQRESYVTFTATANTTYFIQVGGGGNPVQSGDGRLTIIGPNPPVATCPSTPICGLRRFNLSGLGDAVPLPWPWSISVPCCMNIQGMAATAVPNASETDLAIAFAASINAACPGTATATDNQLWVRARRCGPCMPFVFRVGPNGTPFDQLCIVPDLLPAFALSTPSSAIMGLCQFNPMIEEEPIADVDCNSNGEPDEFDIATGTSLDVDGNGVPDECQIPLSIVYQVLSNQVVISWPATNAILEQSTNVAGPWNDVPGATSPRVVGAPTGQAFFRLRLP